MKGASPYHYPKPSATPKRGGLFMFFDFGARPRDPGVHRGAALDPALCVAQCSHAVWTCACGPALAPPGAREGVQAGEFKRHNRIRTTRRAPQKLCKTPSPTARSSSCAPQRHISRHTATRGRPRTRPPDAPCSKTTTDLNYRPRRRACCAEWEPRLGPP